MTLANLRAGELDIREDVGDEILLAGIIREKLSQVPWTIPGGTTWSAPIVDATGVTVDNFTVTASGSTISIGLTAAKTTALGPGTWRFWVRPTINGKPVAWLRGTLTLTELKNL